MPNYPRRRVKNKKDETSDNVAMLSLFQEWYDTLPEELRSLMLKGATAKEILKKYEAHSASRLVAIALTEKDSGKALAAVKEIQDRVSGRPTEHKKIEHKMAELSDDQLDALLLTEMEDMDGHPEEVQ